MDPNLSNRDTDDLASVVEEELNNDPNSDVQVGAKSQAELDAENAVKEPQEPVQSPDAPIQMPDSPALPGDKVVPSEPSGAPKATDLQEQLKEYFPDQDFKSLDDVKGALSTYNEAAKKAEELEQKTQEYELKMKEVVNPFANEDIAQLNAFVKETGKYDLKLFNALKGSNLQEMDPLDVMKLKMSVKHPTLTEEEVKDYLLDKYQLNKKSFDDIYDDDERALAEEKYKRELRTKTTALKIDADEARGEFAELQEKIKPVDMEAQIQASQQQKQEQIQKSTKEWNPLIQKSIEGLREFPIEALGENGSPEKVASFKVPEDRLGAYHELAMQYAIANGIAGDDDGKAMVNDYINMLVKVDHYPQIIQKAMNAAKASLEEEVERKISNPSGTKLPPSPDQAVLRPPEKSPDELEDSAAENAMRILESGDY